VARTPSSAAVSPSAMLPIAGALLPEAIGRTMSDLAPPSLRAPIGAIAPLVVAGGIGWVEMIGVDAALTSARLLAHGISPAAGVTAAATAQAVTSAFAAKSVTALAAAGGGAVAVGAAGVGFAGWAGYQIGTGINNSLSDATQMTIGGTVNEIVEHGWQNVKETYFDW